MILHGGDTECKLIACGHSVFLHKTRRFECSQKCNLADVNPKKIKRGNGGRERFFFPKQNKLDIGTFRFQCLTDKMIFFAFFLLFSAKVDEEEDGSLRQLQLAARKEEEVAKKI